jgi:hypothetical protein
MLRVTRSPGWTAVQGCSAPALRSASQRTVAVARSRPQDEREFLAADARHEVDRPAVPQHDCRAAPQYLVAHAVPHPVVDDLEVVEVCHCERQRLAHGARHVDLGGEPAAEGAAIRDGGQRVFLRLAFQGTAALAERVYQALLLLVGSIELPRALCHTLPSADDSLEIRRRSCPTRGRCLLGNVALVQIRIE